MNTLSSRKPRFSSTRINKVGIDEMYEWIRRRKIKAYKKDGTIYVVNKGMDRITRGAEILGLEI